jgi:hypothetical protein
MSMVVSESKKGNHTAFLYSGRNPVELERFKSYHIVRSLLRNSLNCPQIPFSWFMLMNCLIFDMFRSAIRTISGKLLSRQPARATARSFQSSSAMWILRTLVSVLWGVPLKPIR